MFTCPRCTATLKAHRVGPMAAWDCGGCGGRAVSTPMLRSTVPRERWKAIQRAVVTTEAASPHPCPSCRNPMRAAETQGLAFEICRRCQLVWFDQGEAPEPERRERLSPEAAEAAARFEVESIARRGEIEGDAAEPLTAWQSLSIRLGLPFEIDATPSAIVPWATIALAVAVIAIGHLTLGDAAWFARFAFLPSAPLRHGGTTLVTYFFLHVSSLHVFGNAYFLAVFGDNVEEAVGTLRFLLLTFLGAAVGALAHALLDPRREIPLVGASAGVSALLAYYALRFPRARIGWLAWNLPAWAYLGIWIGFQMLTSIRQAAGFSNVSAFGHLGGAAVGVAFWAAQRRMGPWTSTEEPPS